MQRSTAWLTILAALGPLKAYGDPAPCDDKSAFSKWIRFHTRMIYIFITPIFLGKKTLQIFTF